MDIVLLQTDVAWQDAGQNIRRVAQMMELAPAAQLYVLPEMWATGFVVRPEGVASDEGACPALEWMRSEAKARDAALCGSLAIKAADGSYRNRHYFVTPEGCTFYDKHHLFSPGGEHLHYSAGNSAVVVSYEGWRWLLLTCYDLRFPVWSRYGGVAGAYDGIIYVANWPAARSDVWQVLLKARAIENQCYVVGVNRVGSDPQTQYSGGSTIIDYKGRTLLSANDQPQCLRATLSLAAQQSFRTRFDALADSDFLKLPPMN